jgi:uncharacterized membrane protein
MSHRHHHPFAGPSQEPDSQAAQSESRPQLTENQIEHQALPAEHRRGLLPEIYFRWRAGEITRLEAFCDVVFGFALTLLVVSLEVPHNYTEMMEAMRGFVPFAVCFVQLVWIWRAHYLFSRRYGLEDPYTSFLNFVLLFLVLFYVYPLKFVFTMLFDQMTGHTIGASFHEVSVLMRIYAAGFSAVCVLFALMYIHAYRFRRELELNAVEELETRKEMQANMILASAGIISFLLAIRHPELAGWWFFILGPVLGVHGAIYGSRVRMLAKQMGIE